MRRAVDLPEPGRADQNQELAVRDVQVQLVDGPDGRAARIYAGRFVVLDVCHESFLLPIGPALVGGLWMVVLSDPAARMNRPAASPVVLPVTVAIGEQVNRGRW